ncbi:MAG: adenylate/guanylate cyclase domain-containing protein [Sinimarinibacterium sp.]
MNESLRQRTLAQITALVAEDLGRPMSGPAQGRLQQILKEAVAGPGGAPASAEFERREVTVLLADLRGFTLISARTPAAQVLGVLNRHLARMSEIVAAHGGTIDKFMGDGIMVLFGAPVAHDDDVQRALHCAVDMQVAMGDLNRAHRALGLPDVYMGIGINSGPVMAGLLGSPIYAEYTVIGDAVNLASRIEALSMRGQILISDETLKRCPGYLETGRAFGAFVKGQALPVSVHEVLAIPALGKAVPRREQRVGPRLPVHLPFTFRQVRGKALLPHVYHGVLWDLGYSGFLAELGGELPANTEIAADIDLVPTGARLTGVYARMRRGHHHHGLMLGGFELTALGENDETALRRFVQLGLQSEAAWARSARPEFKVAGSGQTPLSV